MTRRTSSKAPPILKGHKRGDISEVRLSGDPDCGEVALMGHHLRYWVRIGRDAKGPFIAELRIIGDETRAVTSEDLRAIPLSRLAAAIAGKAFDLLDSPEWHRPDGPGRRKARVDDAQLQEVADLARQAFQGRQRVRETLAAHFQVSPFTVDKWLAKARERGFLKSGELSKQSRKST